MFYGWKIVAALFVSLTVSSGLGFYNNTIIIQALARDSGFPVETASAAVSFFFFISGISGLAIAPLLERIDVRWVVAVGTLAAGLGLPLIGMADTVTQLMLAYALFGFGFCASGLLPATTLVARWFETSRAKALSLASTGLSMGGITLTPLSAALVDSFNLPDASLYMGVLYVTLVLPVCLVLRSWPSDLGISAHGSQPTQVAEPPGITITSAIRHHFFWVFSLAYLFCMSAQVGSIAHQYGLLIERVSAAEASLGIAILPLFSVIGRLAGGWALDLVPIRRFTLVMMATQSLTLLLLAMADSLLLIYACLAVFGVTVGNLLMLQPLIVAEVYGLRHYARIYSWSNLGTMLGLAGGPLLMGVIFSQAGYYQLPYTVAAGLGFVAALLFLMTKPPSNEIQSSPAQR